MGSFGVDKWGHSGGGYASGYGNGDEQDLAILGLGGRQPPHTRGLGVKPEPLQFQESCIQFPPHSYTAPAHSFPPAFPP